MERVKVIIDTDPGVDDNFALLCALNDDRFDIKLISISNGNVDIHKSTRNALHLLDVFNKDIPVAIGAQKPLKRKGINAKRPWRSAWCILSGCQQMGTR